MNDQSNAVVPEWAMKAAADANPSYCNESVENQTWVARSIMRHVPTTKESGDSLSIAIKALQQIEHATNNRFGNGLGAYHENACQIATDALLKLGAKIISDPDDGNTFQSGPDIVIPK